MLVGAFLSILLSGGEYEKLQAWLPEFVRVAEPEMGGRHPAMRLGVLLPSRQRSVSKVHACGPSSGSGSCAISLRAGEETLA